MTLHDRLTRALAAGQGRTIDLLEDALAPEDGPLTPAAVLVAVTDRAEPGVILTQRTETLRKHAGEVAFPGGRIDPEDDGPVAAALREAEEETALSRAVPQVVGTLDPFRTRTGFSITPVLATVPPDLSLVAQEHEVAAIFEVPLRHLLDVANHVERRVEWEGALRTFYEIPFPGRRIWGVTAALIVNLGRRLDPAALAA
ncbi:CoA pyrophosphatase [Sphingomonas jatrophae]|uniref:8-oxo-dGTP pyrophosphatase MutT, NUDIX family n=1 Tax=Sphingomonas jatrophae TaxID=1166337 RepID=A0A1I6M6A3_9SPHN|nr:CoA pyrophosphatase [Sphingomonas jatrophae]SFS11138.1 8-oxo-dGTP pyrophosphatase MutT, NUDIX family [Sphingomonas jatrophae]